MFPQDKDLRILCFCPSTAAAVFVSRELWDHWTNFSETWHHYRVTCELLPKHFAFTSDLSLLHCVHLCVCVHTLTLISQDSFNRSGWKFARFFILDNFFILLQVAPPTLPFLLHTLTLISRDSFDRYGWKFACIFIFDKFSFWWQVAPPTFCWCSRHPCWYLRTGLTYLAEMHGHRFIT